MRSERGTEKGERPQWRRGGTSTFLRSLISHIFAQTDKHCVTVGFPSLCIECFKGIENASLNDELVFGLTKCDDMFKRRLQYPEDNACIRFLFLI